MDDKKNFFELLDGKSALLLGMIGSILIVCTIGFFILGAYTLKSGTTENSIAKGNTIPTTAPIPSPTPAQPPANNALPAATVPPVNESDHIRGDIDAPITIIEYSDFECPFCQRFHPTLQQVLDEYEGDVNWVYRHFPLTSIHPNAQKLAEGSECASELGGSDAFWAYADAVFATSNYTNESLSTIAQNMGISSTKFSECLTNGKYTQYVQTIVNDGLSAGVNGTPGSFLIGKNGEAQLISGAVPYQTIKAAIDAELSR